MSRILQLFSAASGRLFPLRAERPLLAPCLLFSLCFFLSPLVAVRGNSLQNEVMTTVSVATSTSTVLSPTDTPSTNAPLATSTVTIFLPDIVGHPGEQAIRHLAIRGLINGFPDGLFRPDDALTRAEFSKLLCFCVGVTPTSPAQGSFFDVPPEHWAYSFIEGGRSLSLRPFFLFEGFPDGTFRPSAFITRAEALTLIVRAKGWENMNTTTTPSSPFLDVAKEHWAYQEILAAWAYGLIDEQEVQPEEPLPRWLAALFIFRAIDQPAIKSIWISLAEQKLYCMNGAVMVYAFPTLTGKSGWPTPAGTYRVIEKLEKVDMRGGLGVEEYYVRDVPWVLFFIDRVYAIHGNYWKPEEYFGRDPAWTGSHGCVGLIPEQSQIVYNWTPVGTLIVITPDLLRSQF